ncbi:hypothetical protein GCM10027577_30730 [Spirosoma fluminis]
MRKIDVAGKRLLMDADTIGHFCKGRFLGYSKYLFSGQMYILEDVEDELCSRPNSPHRKEVIQAIQGGVFIRLEMPNEVNVINEYNSLCKIRSAGEAACLAVARFVRDTIVVTNLPCLADYCKQHGLAYIDTVGLLWIAYNESILADKDLAELIRSVRRNGGRLSELAVQQLPIVV